MPTGFQEGTWRKLESAVKAVQQKCPVDSSYQELYEGVQDMCNHKLGEQVYAGLSRLLEEHAQSVCARLKGNLVELGEDEALLQRAASAWSSYCEQLSLLRQLFLYLDRTYVLQSSHVKPVWELGVSLFKHHLRSADGVEGAIVTGIVSLTRRERSGEAIDRMLANSLCSMFLTIGTYEESLEPPLLTEARDWYMAEGDRMLPEADAAEYLSHCESRISQENQRCSSYLANQSRAPLVRAVEEELLARHTSAILEKGFEGLCEDQRLADLSRLYSLFSRVGALDEARSKFVEYVKGAGERVVSADEGKEREVVPNLLSLKQRLDEIVQEALKSDERFARALREAFEHTVNKRANKPAELVAKYVDSKLRPGNKGQTEADLESTLDQVLTLFRHIEGKDVFEAFYKKDLAKRLLMGKSASVDAEKSMISKLKAECGSQFTTKLEGMFKDVELSQEVTAQFREHAAKNTHLVPPSVVPSVTVLTGGFWPSYPQLDVNLPEELSRWQQAFSDFYLAKHSGRQLRWQHTLGHCTLRARFPSGTKEVVASLFQTCALLHFNDCDRMSFKELQAAVELDPKELKRNLQALACGKSKILVKDPEGKEVEDTDSFDFNASFSDKQYRIKVNTVQLRETPEEQAQTNERVNQDRQHQIDAAAVRVMKTRKRLSHQLLVSEVFKQLRFSASPADIKRRIESLIEREYLERDPSDPQSYRYLA